MNGLVRGIPPADFAFLYQFGALLAIFELAIRAAGQDQTLFKRTRFQQESLQRVRRKRGPDYWVLRWREPDADGTQVRRKTVVGTVEEHPTESKAQQAPSALRITINQEKPREIQNPITVSDLIHHFKESELDTSNDWEGKAYLTRV